MKVLQLHRIENSGVKPHFTYRVLEGKRLICERKTDAELVAVAVDKVINQETKKKTFAIPYLYQSLDSVEKISGQEIEADSLYGIAYLYHKEVVSPVMESGPEAGKVKQIVELYNKGMSAKEIELLGYHPTTVRIQLANIKKNQVKEAVRKLRPQQD